MIEISASELRKLIADAPPRREYYVRLEGGALWMTASKHQAEILADATIGDGKGARPYVSGMVNTKHGVRWLKLLVPARQASKLLRKKLCAPMDACVPDDRRTIERTHCAGGGIIYSHRHDIALIWRRKRGDFKGSGSKSPLVVPRHG